MSPKQIHLPKTIVDPEFETMVYAALVKGRQQRSEGKKRRAHMAEFKGKVGLEAGRGVK
jgi:hypothetical protein